MHFELTVEPLCEWGGSEGQDTHMDIGICSILLMDHNKKSLLALIYEAKNLNWQKCPENNTIKL